VELRSSVVFGIKLCSSIYFRVRYPCPSDPKARSRFLTPHKSSYAVLLYISVHDRVFRLNCASPVEPHARGGLSLHSLRIDRSANTFPAAIRFSPAGYVFNWNIRIDPVLEYRSMRSWSEALQGFLNPLSGCAAVGC